MGENISEEPVKKDWLKENQPIIEGLKDLNKLLTPQEYRILGSVVPASLESPYRKIHDIDMLVVEEAREKAGAGLESLGYQTTPVIGFGNIAGVRPLRFSKGETEIDMFFGKEDKDGGWRYPLAGGFSLYVPPAAW